MNDAGALVKRDSENGLWYCSRKLVFCEKRCSPTPEFQCASCHRLQLSNKPPFDAKRLAEQGAAIEIVAKTKKESKREKLLQQTTEFLDDAEDEAWDFKATIAYWTTVFGIEGVLLFTIGCVMEFPGMTPAAKPWVAKAWVSWTFFIGGCMFTVANYLCFYQVINKHNSHSGHHPMRWLSWADGETDGGHIATLMNFIGAILFNICVGEMFGWPDVKGMRNYNINYVGIGSVGSALFTAAAFIQGEYNEWRKCKLEAPVLLSHFNFWGSFCFLFGYLVEINKFATTLAEEGNNALLFWGVDVTFLVGTLFFLFSCCTDLVLWQSERFGLGFAKSLTIETKLRADVTHLATITVITGNVCIAWLRLCFLWSHLEYCETDTSDDPYCTTENKGVGSSQWSIFEKMIAYHGLLLIMSMVHKAPETHPWDWFLYIMQAIAVYGLIGECVQLNVIIKGYSE